MSGIRSGWPDRGTVIAFVITARDTEPRSCVERTTDYRRLTLRIPARIHELLAYLARDEQLPQ
jgi:hypothetical protein